MNDQGGAVLLSERQSPGVHSSIISHGSARRPRPERFFVIAAQVAILAIMWREITGSGTIVAIGSYNLGTYEFILAASLLAVAANTTTLVRSTGPYLLCASALLVILVTNVVRGALIEPLASITALRLTGPMVLFPLLAPLVPGFALGVQQIRKNVIAAAIVLALLCLVRRATGLLQTSFNITDGRPMLSWGGLLIAMGCVLILSDFFRHHRRRSGGLLLLCYAGLVTTGQGTANICAIIGCGVVITFEPGRMRTLRLMFAPAVCAMLAAVLLLAPNLLSPSTLAGVGSSEFASYLADRSNTNETRHYVWQGLWNSYAGWSELEQLLGLPSGVKPVVWIPLWNGTYWQFSMHSTYLQTLVNVGMVGLVLFVLLFITLLPIALWRALVRQQSTVSPISPAAGAAILMMVAVFGYSYDLGGELAPLLMLGFGSALSNRGRAQQRSIPLLPSSLQTRRTDP